MPDADQRPPRLRRAHLRHATSKHAPMAPTRLWWMPLLNLVLPGAPRFLRSRKAPWSWIFLAVPALFWVVGVFLTLMVAKQKTWAINLVVNPEISGAFLLFLVLLAAWYLVTYLDLFGVVNFARLRGLLKPGVAVLITVLLVASAGSASLAAYYVNTDRNALSHILGGNSDSQAHGGKKGPTIPALTPVDGRYNILLLGGDAGSDREGRRPDSILALSVDANTGQVATISIPRNFENVQFPANSPMKKALPDGYNCPQGQCIIDHLYADVNNDEKPYKALYPHAKDPGAEAMKEAASEILGLTMQAYVLVDMDNFAKLVDALGGVTVTNGGWVPMSGEALVGDRHLPPVGWIKPGKVKLTGQQALWFSRSREYTTDYARNARQQCMIQAMVKQLDPITVLTKFNDLAQAGQDVFETDIDQKAFITFVDLAVKAQGQQPLRLTIGPPDFPVSFAPNPDYGQIHQRVSSLLGKSAPQSSESTEQGSTAAQPGQSGNGAGSSGAGSSAAPAQSAPNTAPSSSSAPSSSVPTDGDTAASMTEEQMQALAVRASQGDASARARLIELVAPNSNCKPN